MKPLLYVLAKRLSNYEATVLMVVDSEKKDVVYRWRLNKPHQITIEAMEFVGICCALKYNVESEKSRDILVSSKGTIPVWIDKKVKIDPAGDFYQASVAIDKAKKFLETIMPSKWTGVIHTFSMEQINIDVRLQINVELAKQDFVGRPKISGVPEGTHIMP